MRFVNLAFAVGSGDPGLGTSATSLFTKSYCTKLGAAVAVVLSVFRERIFPFMSSFPAQSQVAKT